MIIFILNIDTMETFSAFAAVIVIGLFACVLFVFFYFRAQMRRIGLKKEIVEKDLQKNQIENAGLRSENVTVLKDKKKVEEQLEVSRSELSRNSSELAARNQDILHYEEKLSEKEKEYEEQRNKLSLEFKNLANEILEEKTRKFTEQNSSRLSEILTPFSERIQGFERKVEDTYQKSLKDQTDLQAELKKLQDLNVKISQEANNLTRALKGDVKKQGNWGEMILDKILERSGLRKGIEYDTQVSLMSDTGKRIQPDVIVSLPDDKHIVIDSKVSLVAYEKLANAEEEDLRQQYLKEHIVSLRKHVKELSEKNYSHALGIHAPDLGLMFVPVEASVSIAVQADQEIFNDAWLHRIVIVSPTTLLATLMTIASIWKQENQTKNALDIAEEGAKLYDKMIGMIEDFVKIGDQLDKAKDMHNQTMKKAKTGTGNIINRIEKMKSLGLKTRKQLPDGVKDHES